MANICIIPAPWRFPSDSRKNIKEFHGKPIIAYSIEAAKKSGLFDKIIVSSDDDEILSVAENNKVTPMERPKSLAQDNVGTQSVAMWILDSLVEEYEMATVLYPTAPLLIAEDLIEAYHMHVLRPCSYVISVAADPLRDIGNFYVGNAMDFWNGLPLINPHTGLYVMPPERAIDINTPEDWKKAEQMYSVLRGKNESY